MGCAVTVVRLERCLSKELFDHSAFSEEFRFILVELCMKNFVCTAIIAEAHFHSLLSLGNLLPDDLGRILRHAALPRIYWCA